MPRRSTPIVIAALVAAALLVPTALAHRSLAQCAMSCAPSWASCEE